MHDLTLKISQLQTIIMKVKNSILSVETMCRLQQTVLKMWQTQPLSEMVQKQEESEISNTR